MNWLGEIVQKHVLPNYTVLDIGCGIMQATTDSLTKTKKRRFTNMPDNIKCKSLLGLDITNKYLEVAKKYFPVMKFDIRNIKSFDVFMDKSFDVVMALDVLEHVEEQTALRIMGQMERIARKKIIIYTPSKFETNEEHVEEAWGLGSNPFQEHHCFITASRFERLGYNVTMPPPDRNTLAIKVVR